MSLALPRGLLCKLALVSLLVAGADQALGQCRLPLPSGPFLDCDCVDSDHDGLCDKWEIAGGIDLNGDGKIDDQHDLELPGADPNRPDIYLQYDYMELPGKGGHTHKPHRPHHGVSVPVLPELRRVFVMKLQIVGECPCETSELSC